MILGVMQPYFLPYIGYWQLLNYVDEYVIYDDVHYIKNGWINRNRIVINNEIKYITLDCASLSSNKKINEIQILSQVKEKLLKKIEYSYKKAKYFNEIFNLVERVICNKNDNLADYLSDSIQEIAKVLDCRTKIYRSSSLLINESLKGEEKILHICENLNASCYINPIGGTELYHRNRFDEKKIQLGFLQTDEIVYNQNTKHFFPNLSIIDVLMHNGIQNVSKMLNSFQIVNGV